MPASSACRRIPPRVFHFSAIDYVSSEHKLQKFTSTGELIKCVGRKGGKEGEFDDPRGLALRDNLVYVCDHNNHRI